MSSTIFVQNIKGLGDLHEKRGRRVCVCHICMPVLKWMPQAPGIILHPPRFPRHIQAGLAPLILDILTWIYS